MAGSSSNVKSNLVSFIDSVTPVVPLKPIPEDCVDALNKVWQPVGGPITEYFTLEDLWKRFNKWSVYGVKTPVALANGQHIMQHFSPFLSAMQIYTNTSSDIIRSATEGTAEDGSKCDYLIYEDETSSNSTFSRAWDEASSNDNDEPLPITNCRNNLYMKFSDSCPPYWRVPFCQKIKELAKQYPALMTLRSTDLSPASWMSVAWYPIYPIPSKGSVKDFSAAFLSFHTLSSYFQDVDCTSGENGGMEVVQKGSMYLPPFGLASYMLVGDVWLKDESDGIRMHTLHRAAGSWLKQLDFYNHDFTFFCVKSGLQLL